MEDNVSELLWEIYSTIGFTGAGRDMTDAQKAQFVSDLKEAAKLLEDELPVYN